MTKYLILFLFWLCSIFVGKAQTDSVQTFTTLEQALKNPDQVEVLDLSKSKLEVFPPEIFTFKNLRELYLNKNKIKIIPPEIGSLTNLEIFEISKNRLEQIPAEIGHCVLLKRLVLNQNQIVALPSSMGKLKKLVYLDMWSNNLSVVPAEISDCTSLKEVDLRVIEMTKDEQDRIKKLLPNAKVHMSPYCSCPR